MNTATTSATGPTTAPKAGVGATFEVYKDKAGEFRWRLRHSNGSILADGSEGFKAKTDCINNIHSVRSNIGVALVQDMSGDK